MNTFKSNRWLTLAVPIVGGLFLFSQPAHAQYANPNSVYGSIAQQAMSGLLNNNQASDMVNRQNNYASRAARLLRNDGGVLTPNDANKLAQEAANDSAKDQRYLAGNTGLAPTGVGGFLGNLFGASPTTLNGGLSYNNTNPYVNNGFAPVVNNGFAPYNGLYGNSAFNSSPIVPVSAPLSMPISSVGGSCNSGWGSNNSGWGSNSQAWLQHKRWEEHKHMEHRMQWQQAHQFGY